MNWYITAAILIVLGIILYKIIMAAIDYAEKMKDKDYRKKMKGGKKWSV
jgi:hypothetical protein